MDDVRALAKACLGRVSDATYEPPSFVLKALEPISRRFPAECSKRVFNLNLTPNAGYGSATCNRCKETVKLSRHPGATGGGIVRGLGALEKLEAHFASTEHGVKMNGGASGTRAAVARAREHPKVEEEEEEIVVISAPSKRHALAAGLGSRSGTPKIVKTEDGGDIKPSPMDLDEERKPNLLSADFASAPKATSTLSSRTSSTAGSATGRATRSKGKAPVKQEEEPEDDKPNIRSAPAAPSGSDKKPDVKPDISSWSFSQRLFDTKVRRLASEGGRPGTSMPDLVGELSRDAKRLQLDWESFYAHLFPDVKASDRPSSPALGGAPLRDRANLAPAVVSLLEELDDDTRMDGSSSPVQIERVKKSESDSEEPRRKDAGKRRESENRRESSSGKVKRSKQERESVASTPAFKKALEVWERDGRARGGRKGARQRREQAREERRKELVRRINAGEDSQDEDSVERYYAKQQVKAETCQPPSSSPAPQRPGQQPPSAVPGAPASAVPTTSAAVPATAPMGNYAADAAQARVLADINYGLKRGTYPYAVHYPGGTAYTAAVEPQLRGAAGQPGPSTARPGTSPYQQPSDPTPPGAYPGAVPPPPSKDVPQKPGQPGQPSPAVPAANSAGGPALTPQQQALFSAGLIPTASDSANVRAHKSAMLANWAESMPGVWDALDLMGVSRDTIAGAHSIAGTSSSAAPRYDPTRRDGYGGPQDFDNNVEFSKLWLESMRDYEDSKDVGEAAKELGIDLHNPRIEGLKVPLLPHQVIGVAWMNKRESDNKYPCGILADDMGLGKTIQMLALMSHRRSSDPDIRTDLVCAPLSLLSQWLLEMKSRAPWIKACIWHGSNPTRPMTVEGLKKYDVILTTHQTLALQWYDEAKAMRKWMLGGNNPNDFLDEGEDGLFFDPEMVWHRLVIDEAQVIRNRNTRVSRAFAHVDCVYRWCLTGTPLTNSTSDYFPVFRLMRIHPWCEWRAFNEYIASHEKKEPDRAATKARAILGPFLLRRRKDDKNVDGKPIVVLPPKEIKTVSLHFNVDERSTYDALERHMQNIVNRYIKAGSILKNMSHIFVLLLRLRQCTIHPELLLELKSEGFDSSLANEDDDGELIRAERLWGKVGVAKLQQKRLDIAAQRVRDERAADDAPWIKADQDKADKTDEDECPVCMTIVTPQTGIITGCKHAFCTECIQEVLSGPAPDEDEESGVPRMRAHERPCPICRGAVSADKIFHLELFEPTEEEIEHELTILDIKPDIMPVMPSGLYDAEKDEFADVSIGDLLSRRRKDKAKREDKKPVIGSSRDADRKPDLKGKGKAKGTPTWKKPKLVPSTKMTYLLDKLREWDETRPGEKCIVVSSFVAALDLLEKFLEENAISSCRYTGAMSQEARLSAIHKFRNNDDTAVMLLSLKAGGVGLNLASAACKVISLDLAWSPAIEAQAFDRVHRIGQTRPVEIERLTIADTVEQRILDLQDRKQQLSDYSLKEGQGASMNKLTVADIAGLFNLDATGARRTR